MVFCLVCAAINIACIVAYQRIKNRQVSRMTGKKVASSQSVEERRIENRLTVYAFVTFAAQVLMAVCILDIYVGVITNNDFIYFSSYNQLPLVNVSCLCRVVTVGLSVGGVGGF